MKKVLGIIGLVIVGILGLGSAYFFFVLRPIRVKDVSYVLENESIVATISFDSHIKGTCSTDAYTALIRDGKCSLTVLNEATPVIVATNFNQIEYVLTPNMNEVLSFTLDQDFGYLVIGEKYTLEYDTEVLGSPEVTPVVTSSNPEVARVNGLEIEGVSDGEAKITVQIDHLTQEFSVVVTSLIHKPILEENKSYVPCGAYTQEQNELLDKLLQYRIEQAGYHTRAGVVAAARFLTLEFPYKLPYFFENGRLNNNTGGRFVDGEGRYYHKGLYLNAYKFSELDPNSNGWGPAIWGCPLMNWQNEAGFVPGVKFPNGMDCSGSVSWAMYNAGYDPKDTGAGTNVVYHDDLGDIGSHIPITMELLNSHTLKAGDYLGSNGHAALIGGITDEHIYVFESTTYWHGLVMHEYTYQELVDTPYLTYAIRMDDYYGSDGNYTAYWE